MHYCYYDNSLCQLLLLEQDKQLQRILFITKKTPIQIQTDWSLNPKHFKEIIRQLDLYFQKKLKTFTIPLSIHGTMFEQQVWQALQKIPYGKTLSYGNLAKNIHAPKAARAVGAAAHKNPFPIIIPCHRLIGSTGKLVGFAAGIMVKETLLKLEEAIY